MPSSDYSITETIPVADHVYKYILKKNGSEIINANRTDIFGIIILSSLNNNRDLKIDKRRSVFTKTLKIIIKEDQYLRNGLYVGVKRGQVFNKIIDKMFRSELYAHCRMIKEVHKEGYYKIIKSFLDIYEITEEELKLESIYRDFKRKNQKQIA